MFPLVCHPHDRKWIHEQLARLPDSMRPRAAKRYSDAYKLTLAEHEGRPDAEGIARRLTNQRLREFVERVAI